MLRKMGYKQDDTFNLISNCYQLLPHHVKCLLDLSHSFFAGFLDAVDIFGQQTFVNSNILGHLRDINLWELTKYPGYLIVRIWLKGIVKTGYMYIFIQPFPTYIITKTAYFEIKSL